MRHLLLAPAVLVALTATANASVAAASVDDPLICVDPGPTHIGPYVIDIPEICLL